MTNDLTTRNQSYVARYNEDADPYADFANEAGSMIVGQLLTCKKGVWGIGKDSDPVPQGGLYLVQVPTMMRGMVKWTGGGIVDAQVGLVREGFRMPHRYALGDLDEAGWEKGPDGSPRDPWVQTYLVVLTELSPPHRELTFSGGSYGAKLACQELCRIYSEEGPANPDTFPVVALATKVRKSAHYGNIVGPWFEVNGWATVEDVKAGRKAGKGKPEAVAPKATPAKSAQIDLEEAIATSAPAPVAEAEGVDWSSITAA